MKQSIVINFIIYFFILLYLYTGGSKLMDLHQFQQQMVASPLLGPVADFVAWALPLLEFLVAILLFIPTSRLKGLYASLVLMILFTIYLIAILVADNQLSCSCGGIVEDLSPRQHLVFNGACIALLIIGITLYRKADFPRPLRWISVTGTTCLFFLIIGIFYSALTDKGPVKTGMEGRTLPAFDLLMLDSVTVLNTRNIPAGQSFIIIVYSPYCIHCQQETREITQQMEKLKNTKIYMLATFPTNIIQEYSNIFQLYKYPNIVLARDSNNFFLSYVRSTSIPYVAIFDAKKRLKEVLTGNVKVDQISRSLSE